LFHKKKDKKKSWGYFFIINDNKMNHRSLLLSLFAVAVSCAVATDVMRTCSTVEGNPMCVDFQVPLPHQFKVDSGIDEPIANLTGSHNYTFAMDTIGNTITFYAVNVAAGTVSGWSSTLAVDVIMVKGGSNAMVCHYSPETIEDAVLLHTPVNPNNGQYYGISHLTACWEYEVTVTIPDGGLVTKEEITYDWSLVPNLREEGVDCDIENAPLCDNIDVTIDSLFNVTRVSSYAYPMSVTFSVNVPDPIYNATVESIYVTVGDVIYEDAVLECDKVLPYLHIAHMPSTITCTYTYTFDVMPEGLIYVNVNMSAGSVVGGINAGYVAVWEETFINPTATVTFAVDGGAMIDPTEIVVSAPGPIPDPDAVHFFYESVDFKEPKIFNISATIEEDEAVIRPFTVCPEEPATLVVETTYGGRYDKQHLWDYSVVTEPCVPRVEGQEYAQIDLNDYVTITHTTEDKDYVFFYNILIKNPSLHCAALVDAVNVYYDGVLTATHTIDDFGSENMIKAGASLSLGVQVPSQSTPFLKTVIIEVVMSENSLVNGPAADHTIVPTIDDYILRNEYDQTIEVRIQLNTVHYERIIVSAAGDQVWPTFIPQYGDIIQLNVIMGGDYNDVVYEIPICAIEMDRGCTLSQGYWKTHQTMWPTVETMKVPEGFDYYLKPPTPSSLFYSFGITWGKIFDTKGTKCAFILSKQLAAAILNIYNGAIPEQVIFDAIETAHKYFSNPVIYSLTSTQCSALTTRLDIFNSKPADYVDPVTLLPAGYLPGHCTDE
jgi:hypothetical protein